MDALSLARPPALPEPVAAAPLAPAPQSGTDTQRAVAPAGAAASGESDRGTTSRRELSYSDADLRRIRELQARDREVRAHERAHLAAAGPHAAGGVAYTFETGPDGRRYAVGGEVQIDTAPVAGDPAATLAKALQVQRAALAPAEPSAQDRRVAAEAAAMAAQARAELAAARAADGYPGEETGNTRESSLEVIA